MLTKTYPSYGFHLVELILGLALLSVVAFISLPSLAGVKGDRLTRQETEVIVRLIERLSLNAQQRRKELTLLLHESSFKAYPREDPAKIIRSGMLKYPVRIDLRGIPEKIIKFYPTGVCTPTSIRILGEDRTCEIRISLRGRVTSIC